MGRRRSNLEQVKLNKQLRNERHRSNLIVTERNREKNTLYQREKREQARLGLHRDPLAQLADITTQQRYLRDTPEVQAIPNVMEEREPIEVGTTIEEDGEILINFAGPSNEEWPEGHDGGFPDEPESDTKMGQDGGLPNELNSDINDGFDGGFPDGWTNGDFGAGSSDDFDDVFLDEPDIHDDGI